MMNRIEVAYKKEGWSLLLHYLDKSLNSNSFLLELPTPEGEYELETILVGYLRTGIFHHELIKEDISRGWHQYSDEVFSKDYKSMYLLPRPGTTWNGTNHIIHQEITENSLRELLNTMLSKTFGYMPGEDQEVLNASEKATLISLFFETLTVVYEDWKVYQLTTDFLYMNEEITAYNFSDASDMMPIGYFEGVGRDYALLFEMDECIYILLTNGYG